MQRCNPVETAETCRDVHMFETFDELIQDYRRSYKCLPEPCIHGVQKKTPDVLTLYNIVAAYFASYRLNMSNKCKIR